MTQPIPRSFSKYNSHCKNKSFDWAQVVNNFRWKLKFSVLETIFCQVLLIHWTSGKKEKTQLYYTILHRENWIWILSFFCVQIFSTIYWCCGSISISISSQRSSKLFLCWIEMRLNIESESNDGSFTEESTWPRSCYVSKGSNNPLSSLQFASYFSKIVSFKYIIALCFRQCTRVKKWLCHIQKFLWGSEPGRVSFIKFFPVCLNNCISYHLNYLVFFFWWPSQ